MICCWGLLAYIKAADTRQNAGLAVRLPSRKAARAEERPRRAAKPAAPIADSPDLPEPTRVHSDRRTAPEMEDPLRSVFDEAGGSGAEDADIDSLIRRTVDDAAPSGDDSFRFDLPDDADEHGSDADNWQDYFTWEEDDKK